MTDQPAWVCPDCVMIYAKRHISSYGATWHAGICDVCWEKTYVTEPRDFGYLRPEWKKHKRKE